MKTSRITRITDQVSNSERVSVYINNEFCVGIRKRTFQGMNLEVGSEITCEELKEKEKLYWKNSYNEDSWKKEKVRLERIKNIIEANRPDLIVKITGFGADSTELIKEHPDEKGVPDLDVLKKNNLNQTLFKVEVTGTEQMRGEGYWIRPDKLEYAENHPDETVYTAVHYTQPEELIRFIKHIPGKQYQYKRIEIRGAIEHYCIFNDTDEEVLTLEEFLEEIKNI